MPDEISQKMIRQDTPGLRKRWFQGDTVDLSVWQTGPSSPVLRFQLVVDTDRIIDYQSGKGMTTGKVDLSRRAGHHAAAATVEPDAALSISVLETAFREFTENPPMSQKRVLKFVAETIHAALCDPEDPHWPDAALPPGADSVLMDIKSLASQKKAMVEAHERRGMISSLMSRFLGGKSDEG